MGVLVRCQRDLDSKPLRTQLALVRFLPRVHAFVLLQLRRLLEALGAAAAAVRPLLRVTQHVDLEVSPSGAGLATLFAFKGFLPRVGQLVLLQSALSPKLLPAHFAAVRSLSGVDEEVLPQGVRQVEALIAL